MPSASCGKCLCCDLHSRQHSIDITRDPYSRDVLKTRAKAVILLIVIALLVSTTVYWATSLREVFQALSGGIARNDSDAAQNLGQIFDILGRIEESIYDDYPDYRTYPADGTFIQKSRHVCVGTASLTVNVRTVSLAIVALLLAHISLQVVLSDAIVWWRACVLWRNSRRVRTLFLLLLCLTFGTSPEIRHLRPDAPNFVTLQ